ncbi:MAG: FtsX-like permease family protein, partial [Planctomycetes bacterium]|nr:FtsX-like permease family protein [Planctomycetota bacterium]
MSRWLRAVPFTWRNLVRRPLRTGLTVLGIAVATFLFGFVGSMREGVARATQAGAAETTLVVYRKNRFCPFASQLPQSYQRSIERIDGVRSVVPVKIVVNNCRASLDVVTFRGVPDVAALQAMLKGTTVPAGAMEAWGTRQDAVLIGAGLAERRRLQAGDRFDAAGVRAWVAAVVDTPDPQSRNAAYAHLGFLQETAQRGGTGGIVTQFNVEVDDPARIEQVAAAIDEQFAHDPFPTTTRPESAFVARAARDVVVLVRFAGVVGWASLAAVFALIANSIALAVRDRVRDHAILQTLGWTGGDIAWMVVLEASMLGLAGGALG